MLAQSWEALHRYRQFAARLVVAALTATAILVPAGRLSAQDYEIWALDQGMNVVHIYNANSIKSAAST
jgi:hypothetical protein